MARTDLNMQPHQAPARSASSGCWRGANQIAEEAVTLRDHDARLSEDCHQVMVREWMSTLTMRGMVAFGRCRRDQEGTHAFHPEDPSWGLLRDIFDAGLHIHFVLTGVLWVSLVEGDFRDIVEKHLRCGIFRSEGELVCTILEVR